MSRFPFSAMGVSSLWGVLLVWGILVPGMVAQAGEKVRLANTPTFMTGLVTLAQARGFFAQEGLEVEERHFPTGNEALVAVKEGKADVAVVAETAYIFHVLENPQLHLFATIGLWDNEVKIMARADRGIVTGKDLAGKKVATQGRLSTHFFLNQFLMKHGLTEADLQTVFVKAAAVPALLVSGEVDAISMREPYLGEAAAALGGRVVVLEEPGLYPKTFNLVAFHHYLSQQAGTVEKLLRALHRAEMFLRRERSQAMAILMRELTIDSTDPSLKEARLRLSLDHKLLLTLERVAEWAIQARLVEASQAPNSMEFFHTGPLRAVDPVSVTVLP